MRIPFIFTCFLAALLAAAPVRQAQAADEEVSFDLFYNNLADDGDWYNTPEYGYVWQPFIAYKSDKWRPYTDGYWAQTDSGWTWVSYENFGWATYHYGRWTRLKDIGWAWVPGYDWGPGWVSWRTSSDYVGWAPLPPKVEQGVYEGRTVERGRRASEEYVDYNDVEPEDTGYTSDVDVQFDIGPSNYNFCETRYLGAPVIREVCLPPERNFVIIERTTNVTNIYYRRDSGRTMVYNNGPDFAFINSHVERPIPRLRLEQRSDAGFLRDGLRSGGNPSLVRGGALLVAAPMIAHRQMNFQQMKPTRIKETLTKPQVERGWSGAGSNPQASDRLREQFKEQAKAAPQRPTNPVIPPAAVPGVNDRATANDQPHAAAGGAAPATDAERQARRDARQRERQGGAQPGQPNGAQPFVSGPQPAAGNAQAPLTDADRIARREARQKERDDRAKATGQPAATTPGNPPGPGNAAGATTPGTQGKARTEQEKEARRAARQAERAGQPVPEAQPARPAAEQPQAPKDQSEEAKAARRAARQQQRGQPGQDAQPNTARPPQSSAPSDPDKEARRAARQAERADPQPAQPAAEAQGQRNDQEREARRAARQAERASQPAGQPSEAQPQRNDQEREARRAAREQQAQSQAQSQPQPQPDREARRAQRQQEQPAQAQPQGQPQPDREARRAQRQQEQPAQAQPQGQPQPDREARRAQRQQEQPAQAQPQAQPQAEAHRAEKQKQHAQPGQTPGQ